VQEQIESALATPLFWRSVVYLLLACVRGFTLIPSTYLVVAALAFFPPVPLMALTLLGILVSSACIYLFSESLRFDEYFERTHKDSVARLKHFLQRNELPVIIGWSFFPLVPTDVICYVCGALGIDFRKFLVGICVGEGAICAIYIFLGDSVLRFLQLRV
jgi:uncharacterized membrane protein YdjX (TVP38/TMEM64 family)